MTYQKWIHRGGQLIVEQYTGYCTFDDVMTNEENLFAQLDQSSGPLLLLSDISRAHFPDIKSEQLSELFQPLDDHLPMAKGMKEAMYTGANQYEDFKKVMQYTDLSINRPVSIIPFNSLDRAFRWLNLTPQEQVLIKAQLSAAFVKKE